MRFPLSLPSNLAGDKQVTGKNTAITNTVILLFDLMILLVCVLLYQSNQINFDGILIPVIALMSSFGPVIALANLLKSPDFARN